jgi:hypothetical protein
MGNRKNPRTIKDERPKGNPVDRAKSVQKAETDGADRLGDIRRKIKEGYYASLDFSERLAEILTGIPEICGESDDELDEEIVRIALAAEIYKNYKVI